MRVVLDTNILISFLLARQSPVIEIYKFWKKQKFSLIYSIDLLEELKRVLNYQKIKQLISEKSGEHLLKRIIIRGKLIKTHSTFQVFEDKSDNVFINCAVDGQADFLVSGDKKHILKKKKYKLIKIDLYMIPKVSLKSSIIPLAAMVINKPTPSSFHISEVSYFFRHIL